MPGDITDDSELSNRPDDLWKSGGWLLKVSYWLGIGWAKFSTTECVIW